MESNILFCRLQVIQSKKSERFCFSPSGYTDNSARQDSDFRFQISFEGVQEVVKKISWQEDDLLDS